MLICSRAAPKNAGGFTLIEIAIATAIMLIAMGLGVSTYTTWIASTTVKTGAESMQSGLQVARAEALKRNQPVYFRMDPTGTGWCVTVDPAGCGAKPILTRSQGEGSSPQVTVTYQNGAVQNTQFDSFGRLQSPLPADGKTSIWFDVTHATLSEARAMRVMVDVGGGARVCEPAVVSATDPRKCP